MEEEPHSCDGGNFEEWNQAKQHWCCYKKGIACDPFNCKVWGKNGGWFGGWKGVKNVEGDVWGWG